MHPEENYKRLKRLSAEERETAILHLTDDEKSALLVMLFDLDDDHDDYALETGEAMDMLMGDD